MEVRGQNHALTIFLLGKNPCNVWAPDPAWIFGEEKNCLPMLGFKLQDCVLHSLVATLTVLPWLM